MAGTAKAAPVQLFSSISWRELHRGRAPWQGEEQRNTPGYTELTEGEQGSERRVQLEGRDSNNDTHPRRKGKKNRERKVEGK